MLAESFQQRNRHAKEDPRVYARALENLARRAFPEMDKEAVSKTIQRRFIHGQPPYIRSRLVTHMSDSINELITQAMMVEEYQTSMGATERPRHNRDRCQNVGQYDYGSTPDDPDYSERADDSYATAATPPSWCTELTDALRAIRRDNTSLTPADPHILDPDVVQWTQAAIFATGVDNTADYDEDQIYALLASKLPPKGRDFSRMDCYYCKQKGHGWMRCPKLRELLKQNGMRSFAPRYIRPDGNSATKPPPSN